MRKRATVELPRYVQRIVDAGREYFYFQRGRGSGSPGPRLKLPGDPHSVEFWEAYKEYLGSDVPAGHTFNDLIAAYRLAREFTNRAPATQRDYRRYLDIISEAWGELLVGSLRPKHIIALRDAWAHAPVAANHLLSVLNWGVPREFSEDNPCVFVPRLEVEEGGARPWPQWAYDLVEEHAREDLRRAVWLGRYTGQRTADIVRMGKPDLNGGGISVTQQKTGKELWIPLHADLKEEMKRWEVGPPWFFVQTPKRAPYTADRFRAAWTRLMNETPAGQIRKGGFTFHGLRASSVEKLLKAGCSKDEIEAITGMSPSMIKRYSRFADQRKLAKAAVSRLEERTGRER